MTAINAANNKIEFMKKIIFSSLLIAGLFISLSGFSAPAYGHGGRGGYHGVVAVHGGFGFHTGLGYAAPRVFIPPVPVPVVYGPAYAPAYNYNPSYYNRRVYVRPYCHRPFYHRW
jgi:hypothetical protein